MLETFTLKVCFAQEENSALFYMKLMMLCLLFFRGYFSIMFAAINIGQSTSLAPDYGKAKPSTQRIFKHLDRKPLMDSYSEEGEKLVRMGVLA